MTWVEYAIIAAISATAVVIGIMIRSRLKQYDRMEGVEDDVGKLVTQYGLVKSKAGYRFGKYLVPKIADKAIDAMTEAGWQYDEDVGEFVKPRNGPKDKVLISTVNAIIDTLAEMNKDQDELKIKVEAFEKVLKTVVTELHPDITQKIPEVKNENPVVVEKTLEIPKESSINVLASFDTAKSLGDLAKEWNTNPNKTMALLQPFLTSKQIIKIGKKYALNPQESV